MPAVWSSPVVWTVAISCWLKVLRTMSSPLEATGAGRDRPPCHHHHPAVRARGGAAMWLAPSRADRARPIIGSRMPRIHCRLTSRVRTKRLKTTDSLSANLMEF